MLSFILGVHCAVCLSRTSVNNAAQTLSTSRATSVIQISQMSSRPAEITRQIGIAKLNIHFCRLCFGFVNPAETAFKMK